MRLLIFFLLLRGHLLETIAVNSQESYGKNNERSAKGASDNPIVLYSKHLDLLNNLIIRQGKPLMIECVYGRDDIADISDLQWHKKGSEAIDGSSSSSIFTTGLLEHGTRHKKKNLHFTSIHQRDEGLYECWAKNLEGIVFTNEANVTVLKEIRWNDESHSVGALVGEPLTIDCGVKAGNDHHQITITDSDGEVLNANMYKIAGEEVTIEKLTKQYDNEKISCVHIESYGEDELPIIDKREVKIDVWYKPEFVEPSIDQYTIVDGKVREVELHCYVSASNPPAIFFTFYRDGYELSDTNKYILSISKDRKKATLKILNVDESDLDEYRCEVNNGKAKNTLIIHLKETNAPSEPNVTLHSIKKHAIIWKIRSKKHKNELPIKEIGIDYLRQSIIGENLEKTNSEVLQISDKFWNDNSVKQKRQKSSSDLYEITGLLQGTEYVFRFRQYSDAGEGPSIVLRAKTDDDNALAEESSNSQPVPFSLFHSSFISIITARYILHY